MSSEPQTQEAGLTPESVPSEPVASLQCEVQRKLGRCMLRLQQYERLLKALAIDFEIAGPSDELEDIRRKRGKALAKLTLGQLVNELTGSYLQPLQPGVAQSEWDPGDSSRIWFRMQTRLTLGQADYDQVVSSLKELVTLRNELVHHFLERFDVWSVTGCQDAGAYLDVSMVKVNGHYAELRHWALSMDDARRRMGAFIASPVGSDLLFDGIYPDGSIDWPNCGIVRCLRAAAAKVAVDGWASLNQVIAKMSLDHPEQTLKRYGCASWRQLLHESKQFKVRREIDSAQQLRRTEFRSLPEL
ncbi:hypothetical protein J2789_004315 [Variovorax paradoxus]|uniref:OST-HTH/LOTUS domain-containing protein n=1 Tax=Variovorax atrisoli TaxID=3394203 RepID=UPI0011991ADF|nr:OST-HTH/LOTUS domain-containing protein [Variovorax paradoxus]MDR6521628.1 hypothetical protein [Variovorax paradoxus]